MADNEVEHSPVVKPVMKRALIVATVLAVAVNAIAIFYATRRDWSPLGPYPTQTIELPRREIRVGNLKTLQGSTPVFLVLVVRGDQWGDLPVSGEKCSSETVTITSSYGWRNVEPPGFSEQVQVGGSATRLAGCTQFAFRNNVPENVRQRVREQAKAGVLATLWAVAGTEVPIRDDGEGVPQPWTTENFVILWEPSDGTSR